MSEIKESERSDESTYDLDAIPGMPGEDEDEDLEQPAKPNTALGQPLPRLWKGEPDPSEKPEETDPGRPLKKTAKGGNEDKPSPKKASTKVKATAPKPNPKPRPADDGDETDKKVSSRPSPRFDTIEARQRARLIVGGLGVFCVMLACYIGYRVLFGGGGSGEVDLSAEEPPMVAQSVPAARPSLENEARYMLKRARDLAKAGRTDHRDVDAHRFSWDRVGRGSQGGAASSRSEPPPVSRRAGRRGRAEAHGTASGQGDHSRHATGPTAGRDRDRAQRNGAASRRDGPTAPAPAGAGANDTAAANADATGTASDRAGANDAAPDGTAANDTPADNEGSNDAASEARCNWHRLRRAAQTIPPTAAPPRPSPPQPIAQAQPTQPAPPSGPGQVAMIAWANLTGSSEVPTTDERPADGGAGAAAVIRRMLPPGFKARDEAGYDASGWPRIIVGERDGGPMVLVPSGTFTMGSDKGEPVEAPAHTVRLSTYYIDQYEVTNKQFRTFLDDSRRGLPPGKWPKDEKLRDGPSEAPAVFVNWRDAETFAIWAGKRLPTEAQWEMAARSTDGRRYPWGDQPIKGSRPREIGRVDLVGRFTEDSSVYGAFDMAGNVMEWTRDWYEPKSFQKVGDKIPENPTGPSSKRHSIQRVVKGGSKTWTVSFRQGVDLDKRAPNLGFRCSLAVEGPEASAGISPHTAKPKPSPAPRLPAPVHPEAMCPSDRPCPRRRPTGYPTRADVGILAGSWSRNHRIVRSMLSRYPSAGCQPSRVRAFSVL